MRRVPGSPNEKQALLLGLDEDSLPYLVADILHFCYSHRDVLVVDGPGDGRRDVASTLPDGKRHLAQCKFHADATTAVGARETDELPVALLKFGATSGVFVTTGRLSPQAKREYLGDFPDFSLAFWDGVQLVDQVLASPLLSAIWFDGATIRRQAFAIAIPYIVRCGDDDMPTDPQLQSLTIDASVAVAFKSDSVPTSVFSPYRPPTVTTASEDGRDTVWSHTAILTGPVELRSIPTYTERVGQHLATVMPREHTYTARFGRPFLMPLGIAPDNDRAIGDRVLLDLIAPISFVISGGAIHTEREWILPDLANWIFPKNVSVAEADWAGWYSADYDCLLMEELHWPIDTRTPFYAQMSKRAHDQFLEASVFALVTPDHLSAIENESETVEAVDVTVPIARDLCLIGWLHPGIADSGICFVRNPTSGEFEVKPNPEWNHFLASVPHLRALIARFGGESIGFEKAIHLAASAGEDLSGKQQSAEARSSELVHYFDVTPSPIYLLGRLVLHVQMWRVSESPAEASATLSRAEVELPDGYRLHWQAKRGRRSKATFVMSTLALSCPAGKSTTDCASLALSSGALGRVRDQVFRLWPDAVLSTLEFWTSEVGFRFDGKQLIGNPFIAFQGNDGTVKVTRIEEDESL